VGTDFTDASACAFAQALKLAQQNGAELLVAHVATAPNCLSFIPPEAYDQWVEESRAEVQKNMSALMQQASDAGVKAHRLWLEGLADDALIKTARRLGVDLIVVGTHQHRFFMSSIATHVVLRAPCAVLTAR
jgi:nucleotide-binding universal stress UspA family protein